MGFLDSFLRCFICDHFTIWLHLKIRINYIGLEDKRVYVKNSCRKPPVAVITIMTIRIQSFLPKCKCDQITKHGQIITHFKGQGRPVLSDFTARLSFLSARQEQEMTVCSSIYLMLVQVNSFVFLRPCLQSQVFRGVRQTSLRQPQSCTVVPVLNW